MTSGTESLFCCPKCGAFYDEPGTCSGAEGTHDGPHYPQALVKVQAKQGDSLFGGPSEPVTVKLLGSGYWHLRGIGLCNWAQPPNWPTLDTDELEESFFGEASDSFRRAVRTENERLLNEDHRA